MRSTADLSLLEKTRYTHFRDQTTEPPCFLCLMQEAESEDAIFGRRPQLYSEYQYSGTVPAPPGAVSKKKPKHGAKQGSPTMNT